MQRRQAPVRNSEYTTGTMNKVTTVATNKPPITARPSGAFCSPPSPERQRRRQHAEEHRDRGHQHRTQAGFARPRTRLQRRYAFFDAHVVGEADQQDRIGGAMPTAMIDPRKDSTLIVVPVSSSIQRIPISAPGTATITMKGSSQDWNSTTMSM